ncbi:chondroitinase family polysaccharide lyase [Proteiniphilum sp. X52]|uniref:chondroitinase family polysaccharide lyase n=1 Tax=Proteiniphilum sp. X52 TaxID=2382159 RepID=UPI000F09CF91|nr:chondroitinase family polysaccharide lyase [Proteiniphilum sp. X52]RNC66399.1 hypothetical protein D7D25_02645 [Proteiniphilum sp. X52]
MKKHQLISLLIVFTGAFALSAQSFEGNAIPSTIVVDDNTSKLSLSRDYFKDGAQSLQWNWRAEKASLLFTDAEIHGVVDSFDQRSGVKLWIYNETPHSYPLVFQFRDTNNTIQYTFDFNMNFTGWRAGWIAYSDMWTPDGGKTSRQNVVSMEIISPENVPTGKLWIDRMEFTSSVDRQAIPDAQIPENNRNLNREIWHWGLLHKWEQQTHDIDIPARLTPRESKHLSLVYDQLKLSSKKRSLSDKEKKQLQQLINRFAISDDGKRGAPLMQKDNMLPGDVHFGHLDQLLDLSARGWYMDGDKEAKHTFVKAIRYMLHQGFAYGSGMGTNHHYGYQVRDLFGAIWWMEDVLKEQGLWEETRRAVTYWSGLQEARQPFNNLRDEITDSWNTLIIPRLICALWGDNENERFRDLKELSRWVNGSMRFSPGTIGGIKIDGTAFHHGGHYPAYSIPGLAYVGRYLKSVNNTLFTLDEEAFQVLKFALLTIARQSNLRDWGIGVSGRHPFNGSINKNGILTFAYAAMIPEKTDKELAGEYLRLMEGAGRFSEDNILIKQFESEGIKPNPYPQGFYVYNYASQGIYRYNKKMVSLKGFTRNVWGSEIYTRDNRFGRYQSYGSIQIIGTPSPEAVNGGFPITEEASRYREQGWDWNRNPGTTSIHLPLELLNSPLRGSDMLRQPESFAGASRLNGGESGMFAMKLGERDRENFSPSFKAHKSVFTFGNRIIALGSAIGNEKGEYPVETTLFQQALVEEKEEITVNKKKITEFPYRHTVEKNSGENLLVKSLTGDYFYIPSGQSFVIEKKTQDSKENKQMNPTQGKFATAYIDHGVAPQNETYEYMILLDATTSQLSQLNKGITGYAVKRKDKTAHIVLDNESNTVGYAIFEELTTDADEFLLRSDKEIMIMLQPAANQLNMSICHPDLNLGEYTYTTPKESQPVTKEITLKGHYSLDNPVDSISLRISGDNTVITGICRHGIPIELRLHKID